MYIIAIKEKYLLHEEAVKKLYSEISGLQIPIVLLVANTVLVDAALQWLYHRCGVMKVSFDTSRNLNTNSPTPTTPPKSQLNRSKCRFFCLCRGHQLPF